MGPHWDPHWTPTGTPLGPHWDPHWDPHWEPHWEPHWDAHCPHPLGPRRTNPLDMDMIDSLALAIKKFSGGIVLVSHDFRLLEQVAEEIWVCDEKKITPWEGDIKSYKDKLRRDMAKASDKMFTGTGVQ